MNEMHIVELTQTCSAAPSQWDARLKDGRVVYIRYRHGELTVRIGPEYASVMDVVGMEPWFQDDAGDKNGPIIDIEEVCEVTGLSLAANLKPFRERKA
jgi:hypothetical protein